MRFFLVSGAREGTFFRVYLVLEKGDPVTGCRYDPYFFERENILIRTERIPMNEILVTGRFAGMMTITRFK
jgi:hypothetical protein